MPSVQTRGALDAPSLSATMAIRLGFSHTKTVTSLTAQTGGFRSSLRNDMGQPAVILRIVILQRVHVGSMSAFQVTPGGQDDIGGRLTAVEGMCIAEGFRCELREGDAVCRQSSQADVGH